MSEQTSNNHNEQIMHEISRLTDELRAKVAALPVDDGDNTPAGRAIKAERKAIINDSICDLKRICSLLDAMNLDD